MDSPYYAQKIVENALDAMIALSPEGTVLYWNRGAEIIFGFSSDEVLGKSLNNLILPPERRQEATDALRRALDTGSVVYESLCRRKDGTEYPVEIRLSPLEMEEGRFAMCAVRDVTDRKRAETERDRFFTLSLDLMCIASTDGFFRRLNPAFERTLGFTIEEMCSRPLLDFIHPEDRQRTLDAIETLSTGAELVNFENRYLCKDGSYRSFSWKCAPFKEEGLIYAAARDITDEKRAEARERERTAHLEVANKELEAFSYSVSHDLRAPLRGMDGYVRMLQEDYASKLDADGNRMLGVVSSEAKRMGHLIDDLLAFSRLGRKGMEHTTVDIADLARTAFQSLTRAARFVNEAPVPRLDVKPLPLANGDHAMLRQVFVNLLGNAIKFTRHKPAPVIEIGGESGVDATTYYVKDNGVGFDQKFSHKLFGVFQRLHSESQFEGTGVGLALVQRVIHRHEGKVWAEGKVGEGATFYFTLPIRKEPAHDPTH